MLPQTLYSLSQSLAVLLEEGIRTRRRGARVPVFLCHPLDSLEPRETPEAGAFGVLYPASIVPDSRQRLTGWSLEESGAGMGESLLRRPALWLRLRYYFLVGGGTFGEQLETLGAILQTLHDTPTLCLTLEGEPLPPPPGPASPEPLLGGARGAPAGGPEDLEDLEDPEKDGRMTLPVRMVEAPDGWRELGLPEHRWTLAFEVLLPMASTRAQSVSRVFRREVSVDGGRE